MYNYEIIIGEGFDRTTYVVFHEENMTADQIMSLLKETWFEKTKVSSDRNLSQLLEDAGFKDLSIANTLYFTDPYDLDAGEVLEDDLTRNNVVL